MLRLMGWHHDRAYIIIHRPGGKAEQYLRKHLFPFHTKYNPVPPSSNLTMIALVLGSASGSSKLYILLQSQHWLFLTTEL
jgi:hypothetical protein